LSSTPRREENYKMKRERVNNYQKRKNWKSLENLGIWEISKTLQIYKNQSPTGIWEN